MENSLEDEFGMSEFEIEEFMVKFYEVLRNGSYKVRNINGIFRCFFCAGKKK